MIYDIGNQLVDPMLQVLDFEPATTGNHGMTKRQEGGDQEGAGLGRRRDPDTRLPARVAHGRVLSRLGHAVPGPETPVEHRTVAQTGEMGLGREGRCCRCRA